MRDMLDRLCEVLEDELERQQLLLALLESQRKAALAQDVDTLDVKTRSIENLILEAKAAETERHQVLKSVVERLGLPPAEHTLTDLIRVVPEPHRHRLEHFQIEFKSTLYAMRDLVRTNSVLLRQSLTTVDAFLTNMGGIAPNPSHYSPTGRARTGNYALQPALLNQRG